MVGTIAETWCTFFCILYSVFMQHDKEGLSTLLDDYKHAHNHPKVDCTKLPPLDDL